MTENKYKRELLKYASRLDAVVDGQGKISKYADIIAEKQDQTATIWILNQISAIVDSENYTAEVKRMSAALNDSLLRYFGYIQISAMCCSNQEHTEEDCRSLPELLNELNELVGLEAVKSKVRDLIAFQKVQQLREKQGLYAQKSTLHMAFTGKPGTGKTTVARIVGKIYKHLGLLSKGHFIEVSRTDLIAGYQGQTALKVKKVIEQAKGGVLFIDEAYSITENDHSDSYGRECLTELTKALEDYRSDLVVIVAGYTEPMNHFFESNPGLRSRFNTFIEFEDYTAEELEEILVKMCKDNDYGLDAEASNMVRMIMCKQPASADENFSNGRFVRNLYDDMIMNHARRVAKFATPSREILSTITVQDIKAPIK